MGKSISTRGTKRTGYDAARIYRENAVAAVFTDVRLQDGECMAGLKGKSGPPGNMNAFKHGLAAIQKRREKEHHHRARGERQAADSRRLDGRQGRGDEQVSRADQDSSGGYRLRCRLATSVDL